MPIVSAIIIFVRILVLYRASKARKERIAEIIEKGVRAYILDPQESRKCASTLSFWPYGDVEWDTLQKGLERRTQRTKP
jgi:hypothetical protein